MNKLLNIKTASDIMQSFGHESLTDFQKNAFDNCPYYGGARELFQAETSAGKTLVPLVAFQAARNDELIFPQPKLLFLVPYRALAVQKGKDFKEIFQNLRIYVSTSENCHNDNNIKIGDCDIAVVIYEKAFSFDAQGEGKFLNHYSHIVFDEIGIVSSPERGLKADYVLHQACYNPKCNIYLLATPYHNWEPYERTYKLSSKYSINRPVEIKKEEIVLDDINKDATDNDILKERCKKIFELCQKHMKEKILVFACHREAVQNMTFILNDMLYGKNQCLSHEGDDFFNKILLAEDDIHGIFDKEIIEKFKAAYNNGISFHHANLPEQFREKIEHDFLNKDILRIVFATETLAYGLNSNVDVVIVAKLDKKDGDGKRCLTANEYYNYIGRAGRLGKKILGHAYTLLVNKKEKQNLKKTEDNNINKKKPICENIIRKLFSNSNSLFFILHQFSDKPINISELEDLLRSYPGGAEAFQKQETKKEQNSLFAEKLLACSSNINYKVQQLVDNKLIKKSNRNTDEEPYYAITNQGKSMLGFLLSEKTYYWINDIASRLNDLTFFIFLYEACKNEEISLTTKRGAEPNKALLICDKLQVLLEKLYSDKQITSELFHDIERNLQNFKKNIELQNKCLNWKFYHRLQITCALWMWSQSISLENIKDRTGCLYYYVNTGSQKIEYFLDAIYHRIDKPEMQERCEIWKTSIRFGIHPQTIEDLRKQDILCVSSLIDKSEGDQLRIISQLIHFSNEKNKNEKIEKCKYFNNTFYQYLKEQLENE